MEYNLSSLREQIAIDRLDDEDYEPDVIDRFINHAQREVFTTVQLPFMEKVFSGSIPNNATVFSAPSDVSIIQSLSITAPDGVERSLDGSKMEFRDFNKRFPTPEENTPGPVQLWTTYGGNILLNRPTDDDYTLTIYYIKAPKKLEEDSDVPEIPEEFGEILIDGAVKRIHKREYDDDLAVIAENDFDRTLAAMIDRYSPRVQTKFGAMGLTNG